LLQVHNLRLLILTIAAITASAIWMKFPYKVYRYIVMKIGIGAMDKARGTACLVETQRNITTTSRLLKVLEFEKTCPAQS